MCTFLGTAGKINENDVSSDAIKKSEIIFLEGYLWDEGEPKKAFDKGLLLVPAGGNVVRFVPPLIISRNEINILLKKLDLIFEEI
mgnify:CR=1 FL=1